MFVLSNLCLGYLRYAMCHDKFLCSCTVGAKVLSQESRDKLHLTKTKGEEQFQLTIFSANPYTSNNWCTY